MPQDDPKPAKQGEAPPQEAAAMAEQALKSAEQAVSKLEQTVAPPAVPPAAGAPAAAPDPKAPTPFQEQVFDKAVKEEPAKSIDLLGDVNLNVKIELGRTRMLVEDVLRLSEGAVVELDKLAGDPVDVYVNERHVARGEVLVLNDNFCVRINEIVQDAGEADHKPKRMTA